MWKKKRAHRRRLRVQFLCWDVCLPDFYLQIVNLHALALNWMLNVRSSACLQLYHRKIVCSLDPRPCLQAASQNIYLFKFQIYLFKLLTIFVWIAEFHLSKSQTDCLLVRPRPAPRPCFRAVSQNIFGLNLKMYVFVQFTQLYLSKFQIVFVQITGRLLAV